MTERNPLPWQLSHLDQMATPEQRRPTANASESDLRETIYHGDVNKESAEDQRLVNDALRAAGDAFNSLPPHLMPVMAASFVLTFCMAQIDPVAALRFVVTNVEREIAFSLAKPEGSA